MDNQAALNVSFADVWEQFVCLVSNLLDKCSYLFQYSPRESEGVCF